MYLNGLEGGMSRSNAGPPFDLFDFLLVLDKASTFGQDLLQRVQHPHEAALGSFLLCEAC